MKTKAEQDERWPFGEDADRDDPLTALRIPVTGSSPSWRYIAAFHRDSLVRPTDGEALMLASYIEEYKRYHFNDWYRERLEERPLDVDAVTRVFHKWGEDDWSYRMTTWRQGAFWVPVGPKLRGGEYDTPRLAAMPLEAVMDRTHDFGGAVMEHWTAWKAGHPAVFGGAG